MHNLYNLGDAVCFYKVELLSDFTISKSVIHGYSVNKIIIEKFLDEPIFSYVLTDNDGTTVIKNESDLFLTEKECLETLSKKIEFATANLKSDI